MTSLIQLQNISVHVGETCVLDNLNCTISPKEITTLIGPNGAGKTTLVRIILGLTHPTTGQIIRQKGLTMGYMPQKLHVPATLPLNVERFLKLHDPTWTEFDAHSAHILGIESYFKKPLTQLSGGELQRVWLMRTIRRKPHLLVLDEPLQGVDMNGQLTLYQFIASLRESLSCAILMVSHDLHWVMAATDKVICLNQHICCSGTPEVIQKDPAYQALFGDTLTKAMAIYTHHHDHVHE